MAGSGNRFAALDTTRVAKAWDEGKPLIKRLLEEVNFGAFGGSGTISEGINIAVYPVLYVEMANSGPKLVLDVPKVGFYLFSPFTAFSLFVCAIKAGDQFTSMKRISLYGESSIVTNLYLLTMFLKT